jgi:hypothetical protein
MRDERYGHGDSGFALILAILSLLLLTFLGLTLAATTSTELQIATNYRWSEQAFYNAEAGLEVAKAYLKVLDPTTLAPDPRGPWTPGPTPSSAPVPFPQLPASRARSDAWGNLPRNFAPSADPLDPAQNCDYFGDGVGYGVVFDDGATPGLPLQNVTQIVLPGPVTVNETLRGAFTVWVRRRLNYAVPGVDDGIQDDTDATVLILTSEGVAPAQGVHFGASGGAGGQKFYANRASRVLEAVVRLGPPQGDTCGGTLPQASETGAHKCAAVDPADLP